jgi:hypothetical protein
LNAKPASNTGHNKERKMAQKIKDMWLKVLIGLIITMMLLGAKMIEKKLDKEVFGNHEAHQDKQFEDMKEYQKDKFESFEKYIKEVIK